MESSTTSGLNRPSSSHKNKSSKMPQCPSSPEPNVSEPYCNNLITNNCTESKFASTIPILSNSTLTPDLASSILNFCTNLKFTHWKYSFTCHSISIPNKSKDCSSSISCFRKNLIIKCLFSSSKILTIRGSSPTKNVFLLLKIETKLIISKRSLEDSGFYFQT